MATDDRDATPSEYVFGHSDEELQRLASQAALIEPITRRLLAEAGIEAGMRVLDVGTRPSGRTCDAAPALALRRRAPRLTNRCQAKGQGAAVRQSTTPGRDLPQAEDPGRGEPGRERSRGESGRHRG